VLDPRSYFENYNLFDYRQLQAHADLHGVHVNRSERFPNLILLKYADEVQWGDKPWSVFSRFARGLVVDMKNQAILAHGFDKFFNLGQAPETQYEILRNKKEFEVSEKLDGSCLISFLNPNDNQFYLTTTGSFDSEHGKVGTELFRNLLCCPKIAAYAAIGTFIFELIDPRFRIVIDYRKKNYEPGLYLIGYRTQEGRLLSYAEVADLAASVSIPSPKIYKYSSLCHLTHKMADLPMDEEGFVILYPDGLRIKIKGEQYLRAHRFVSQLSDKNILQALVDGIDQQMLEVCPDEFRLEIVEKVAYFKSRKLDLMNECYKYFADAPKESRKNFAIWIKNNTPAKFHGYLFNLMDGKVLENLNFYDIVLKYEKVSGETKI
jgi:hypothetical protein